MAERTVAAAGVFITYAPPATTFRQPLHFQIPVASRLTESLPQTAHRHQCHTQRSVKARHSKQSRGTHRWAALDRSNSNAHPCKHPSRQQAVHASDEQGSGTTLTCALKLPCNGGLRYHFATCGSERAPPRNALVCSATVHTSQRHAQPIATSGPPLYRHYLHRQPGRRHGHASAKDARDARGVLREEKRRNNLHPHVYLAC